MQVVLLVVSFFLIRIVFFLIFEGFYPKEFIFILTSGEDLW